MDDAASSPALSPFSPVSIRRGYILLGAILLLFLGSAGFFLWFALCVCHSVAGRTIACIGVVVSLGLPVWAFAVMLHRKLTKGRWLLTLEDRRERYARTAGRHPSRFTTAVLSPWFDAGLAAFMLLTGILWGIRAYHHGTMGSFYMTMCAIWGINFCLWSWSAMRKLRRSPASV
jgi:hypothetical protein